MNNKFFIMMLSLCVCANTLGSAVSLTLENDSLISEDNDYTHGTKIEVEQDNGLHFMIEQTMYAPSDITRKEHIVGDRPYCGMLIGGVGYEFMRRPASPWTHYGELDLGLIGPAAGCKETQTLIHRWLDCKKPMGWDNQLHNEFVINGQWWSKYHWYLSRWMAIVPRGGIAAGTIQDFAEVGCDLKIGWNIQPKATNDIIFSAPKSNAGWLRKLTAYIYVGVDERYYLYNHILEGSLFNHKDKELKVDINHFVGEARCGFVLQYERFFFTYYMIFRQHEFKGQKNSPNYGGIGIGWSW